MTQACRSTSSAPTTCWNAAARWAARRSWSSPLSIAVYGGEAQNPLGDHSYPNPQTSYGGQKAIGEILINDYSRKGYIDGRAFRLPTISVRPGKPNRAASSFMSSILREPLNGPSGGVPRSTAISCTTTSAPANAPTTL